MHSLLDLVPKGRDESGDGKHNMWLVRTGCCGELTRMPAAHGGRSRSARILFMPAVHTHKTVVRSKPLAGRGMRNQRQCPQPVCLCCCERLRQRLYRILVRHTLLHLQLHTHAHFFSLAFGCMRPFDCKSPHAYLVAGGSVRMHLFGKVAHEFDSLGHMQVGPAQRKVLTPSVCSATPPRRPNGNYYRLQPAAQCYQQLRNQSTEL